MVGSRVQCCLEWPHPGRGGVTLHCQTCLLGMQCCEEFWWTSGSKCLLIFPCQQMALCGRSLQPPSISHLLELGVIEINHLMVVRVVQTGSIMLAPVTELSLAFSLVQSVTHNLCCTVCIVQSVSYCLYHTVCIILSVSHNLYHTVCITQSVSFGVSHTHGISVCITPLAGMRNSSMGLPWRFDPTTHRTTSKHSYHLPQVLMKQNWFNSLDPFSDWGLFLSQPVSHDRHITSAPQLIY